MEELEFSRKKSNKDVICTACWKIYNYEEVRLHRSSEPAHQANILSSKYFAGEKIFLSLAKQNGKVFRDGQVI